MYNYYNFYIEYRDGLIAVEEVCEAISVFVDDLWKLGEPAYTEERMKSFLDIIGNEMIQLVQNYLNAVCRLKNLFNHLLCTLAIKQ